MKLFKTKSLIACWTIWATSLVSLGSFQRALAQSSMIPPGSAVAAAVQKTAPRMTHKTLQSTSESPNNQIRTTKSGHWLPSADTWTPKFLGRDKASSKQKAILYLANATQVKPYRKVRTYLLESVELTGTERLTIEQLAENLNLKAGVALNDDFVMTTRARLLSLGIFKSVILVMRKGTSKGLAHLVFNVEDDEGVIGKWAIGGSLAVTQSEVQAQSASKTSAPLGYRLELVSRNIMNSQHRGSSIIDVDAKGIVREGRLAYGLPRFSAEDAQFDAEISVIDVNQRYLHALGFGERGQGLWSSNFEGIGTLQYGVAMYVNTAKRFRMPGYPKSVAGPKLAITTETRLMSFIPTAGYGVAASLVLSPIKVGNSLFELNLGKTIAIGESRFTLSADALQVGLGGYGFRSEARFDYPLEIKALSREKINFYAKILGGVDVIQDTDLLGSAAIFGLRYYSSGFIAEFAVQVTRVPAQLSGSKIIDPSTSMLGGQQ